MNYTIGGGDQEREQAQDRVQQHFDWQDEPHSVHCVPGDEGDIT